MAVGNTLVKNNAAVPAKFSDFVHNEKVQASISNVLTGRDKQRFVASVITAVSTNPTLSECRNSTILSAALLGESLKLSPSPQLGHFYMVPYNVKAKYKDGQMISPAYKAAQFQIGYKGYIQLAIRSGFYKKLTVLAIKKGELINFDPINEEIEVKLVPDEEAREALPTIGYYAMFEYLNGFRKAIYWSHAKMMAHADRFSQAFNAEKYKDLLAGKIPEKEMWKYSSFWYKDFDSMAVKTMLRQLISKWGIMSVEMQTAYSNDMAVVDDDGSVNYVDSPVDTDQEPEIDHAPATTIDVDPETGEVVGVSPVEEEDDPTAAFFGDGGGEGAW